MSFTTEPSYVFEVQWIARAEAHSSLKVEMRKSLALKAQRLIEDAREAGVTFVTLPTGTWHETLQINVDEVRWTKAKPR